MEYHVLASGSKGNSVFIYDHNVGLLIDCGISNRQLIVRLASIGYRIEDIDVILVTHDHSDHVKGIDKLDFNLIYCGNNCVKDVADNHYLTPYEVVELGGYLVTPLETSHDATNPLAYLIEGKSEKLLYMTDTGYVLKKNLPYIVNLDYYIFEANHDVEMLMATDRPYFLKQRIYGDLGHLNNEYSARIMAKSLGKKTKEICLAHLSEQANSHAKALETYIKVFKEEEIEFRNIKIAFQNKVVSGGSNED